MTVRLLVALAGLAAAPAVMAQNAPKRDASPPASNRVIVSRGQTIAGAVAGMAKAAGALAAVDPDLEGRVSEATSKLPLEEGLTAIARANHATWRKVYLAESEIPKTKDGAVDARTLKRMVAAVPVPTVANIGLVDPGTGQMTVTTRAAEDSPAMKEWAKTRKAVYLLYVPGDEPAVKVGGDMLPPGGIDAFKAMTPEQRAQWMKDHGGVIVTSDMSAEERAQALQNLPPEERARIEEKMKQSGDNGGKSVIIMRQETN